MLGIIIGVGAVITLVSIGDGFSAFITAEFENLGTNVLQISADSTANDNTGQLLTMADADALRDSLAIPGIKAVSPVYQRSATAGFEGLSTNTTARGVTPEFQAIRSYELAVGRFIEADDVDFRRRVVVLGHTVAQELFPNSAYPIGETIRIENVTFEVVGVAAEKGDSGPINNDNVIFVPISTAQTRLFHVDMRRGEYVVSSIQVQTRSEDVTKPVMNQITEVLRERHRLDPDEDNDFTVASQADLLNSISVITSTFTIFLGAIAGISLLVGGIGIMNIMLVSVTERTREIGLRKAIGAGKNDILLQFIIEAVSISSIGGLIGIILGFIGSIALAPVLSLTVVISPDTILLAAGFSAMVGLFFGIYPAMRAANLNPIDALRYE
jgi:putative ABC transport system permease protein